MRNYWIAFVLIVATGLAGLGVLVFKCFIQKPGPIMVYLNIERMTEAGKSIADSNSYEITSVFQCRKKNTVNDSIPWADLYVCKSHTNKDSLSGDTALLFIDIHPKEYIEEQQRDAIIYSAKYKIAPKYKGCKILIPANQLYNIKRYRYKFGDVEVTEMLED